VGKCFEYVIHEREDYMYYYGCPSDILQAGACCRRLNINLGAAPSLARKLRFHCHFPVVRLAINPFFKGVLATMLAEQQSLRIKVFPCHIRTYQQKRPSRISLIERDMGLLKLSVWSWVRGRSLIVPPKPQISRTMDLGIYPCVSSND
jgi:hypothetical protein